MRPSRMAGCRGVPRRSATAVIALVPSAHPWPENRAGMSFRLKELISVYPDSAKPGNASLAVRCPLSNHRRPVVARPAAAAGQVCFKAGMSREMRNLPGYVPGRATACAAERRCQMRFRRVGGSRASSVARMEPSSILALRRRECPRGYIHG